MLNPDAVDSFIDSVYERFYQELKPFFNKTIIGIFTDEPNMTGRCRESGIKPGTTGIVSVVSEILGYDFIPHLPALWFDDEPDALRHRTAYYDALNTHFEETWYAKLSDWCIKHNTALCGHPAESDEISSAALFSNPRPGHCLALGSARYTIGA